jgi:hypothetical protein
MLLVYAVWHLWLAIKTRASDVLLHIEGVHVDGGRLNGARFPWTELSAPFAEVEETTATRLVLWRIFAFFLSLGSRSREVVSPVADVKVWKLWLFRSGERKLVAETDRAIEASSLTAAASSIEAVMNGRKYVAEAPAIAADVTTCGSCGAPVVPDDAPTVACTYCRHPVPLPPQVRGQAAASKAMQQSRATHQKMIAKLLEQPEARTTNGWLLFFSALMFGAWPIGWGLIGYRVLGDGFQGEDAMFLALPLAAVLAGFFFARGRLADRGALQLLTLGYGALAPRREGEPSRCRRCQGPLPEAGAGGVTQCRYCHAENIVGLDLRPSVDPARTEQVTFDQTLKKRAREKLLWGFLTVIAAIALLGWVGGTIVYVAGLAGPARTSPVAVTPTPAPASAEPAPSATHTPAAHASAGHPGTAPSHTPAAAPHPHPSASHGHP